MGGVAEIAACVPPQGQERDRECTPDWSWELSSNPGPEGNAESGRKMELDLNVDYTNVDGGVQPNVNLGFGSNTVDQSSSPRAKSSISDWTEFELASPALGNGSRTEVETPPLRLALALSPPPSPFRGDYIHGGDTRSAFQAHVRVSGLPRTPSRFPRGPSRLGFKRPIHARFRDGLASGTVVMNAVDTTDGVDARVPDRRSLGIPSGKQQGAPCIDKEKQEKRHKLVVAGARPSDLDNHSPGPPPSGFGTRIHSTAVCPSSPRTEIFPGSRFHEARRDYHTAHALRRRLRSDGLNETGAGEAEMDAGGSGNDLGGAGFTDGYHQTRSRSMILVDGLDSGGESDRTTLGGGSGQVEQGAFQDWDVLSSHRSHLSYSTPESCADADVDCGSRGSLIDSPPTAVLRPRFPRHSSDHGSVPGSHLRHHVKNRTMGDVLSPSSRTRIIRHQNLISGSIKAFTPSFSSSPPEPAPYSYDERVLRGGTELNTGQNTSWPTQTHKHVRGRAQEFDTLRFSSSSPSRSISMSASLSVSAPHYLLSDNDKLDEDHDSGAESHWPGLAGHIPLNAELRSYMKANMTPNSNTRTGLNGNTAGVPLNRDTLGPLISKFINDRGDNNGSVSRHVDGIGHGDMGGPRCKDLGSSDLDGRTSTVPVFVSVSGVSGVSKSGSLSTPAPDTRLHPDGEDTRSTGQPDSRTAFIQRRSTDREEPEECGLLKSLLESSDPWSLMKKVVLNLPSPAPLEVERREESEEDVVRVRRNLERRGVGYVTPPSMDALLGAVSPSGEMEMEEVEEGGGCDEDSREILDFHSSQPRMGHLLSFFYRTRRVGVDSLILSAFFSLPDARYESSISGIPSPDFASTPTKLDIFSDTLYFPNASTQLRPYRGANHEGGRHGLSRFRVARFESDLSIEV